jgi:hypothetical protein
MRHVSVDLKELVNELPMSQLHSYIAKVFISFQLISLLSGSVILKFQEQLLILIFLLMLAS